MWKIDGSALKRRNHLAPQLEGPGFYPKKMPWNRGSHQVPEASALRMAKETSCLSSQVAQWQPFLFKGGEFPRLGICELENRIIPTINFQGIC